MRFPISRAILLLAAALLVPACGKTKKNQPPLVLAVRPDPLASSGIGMMPNILVQFDQNMDETSVEDTTNWSFSISGAVSGLSITVEYLPALMQARIIPTQLLQTSKTYGVVIGGGIKSASGVATGNALLFTFDTQTTTTTTSILGFGTPTVGTNTNSGEITLNWTSAQESGVNVTAFYDVYVSTTAGGENLMLAPKASPTTDTGTTLTGLTPTTQYFIKVQPRDGAGAVFTSLVEITATSGP